MASAIPRMSNAEVLRRIGGDAFLNRLLDQIEQLAQETGATGEKGKLVVTFETAKPKGSTLDDPMIQFGSRMVPTHPAPRKHMTLLYVSDDGLHTDDPRQMPMQPRLVEQAAPEVRETAAESVVREVS